MSFKQWLFSEGYNTLPTSQYLYKTKHLIMLFSVVISALVLSLFFRKKSKKAQDIVLTLLVFLMIFLEIVYKTVTIIKMTNYTFLNMYKALIPCHFSSVAAVFIIVAHFSQKEGLRNVMTIAGLLSSISFLVHPAVGVNADKILYTQLYSIVTHGLQFVIPILWIVFKRVDFSLKKIYQPIIFFIVVVCYALFLNLVLYKGSNYMYFMKNELSFDVNIHLYRLGMFGILALLLLALYLKDLIKTIKGRKLN